MAKDDSLAFKENGTLLLLSFQSTSSVCLIYLKLKNSLKFAILCEAIC